MDDSEVTAGHRDDAEIDVVSLALGWICLRLTSGVLAQGRLSGVLDVSWATVAMPVLMPFPMALAYATVLAWRDRRAARWPDPRRSPCPTPWRPPFGSA